MRSFSTKTIKCRIADIHVHWANNAGRGDNNVTLTVVPIDYPRPPKTAQYQEYISRQRVSGWRGHVSIPDTLIEELGGIAKNSQKKVNCQVNGLIGTCSKWEE